MAIALVLPGCGHCSAYIDDYGKCGVCVEVKPLREALELVLNHPQAIERVRKHQESLMIAGPLMADSAVEVMMERKKMRQRLGVEAGD